MTGDILTLSKTNFPLKNQNKNSLQRNCIANSDAVFVLYLFKNANHKNRASLSPKKTPISSYIQELRLSVFGGD